MPAQNKHGRKSSGSARRSRRKGRRKPTAADFRRLAFALGGAALGGALFYFLIVSLASPGVEAVHSLEEYKRNRAELDEHYWEMEVLAQDYETVIIKMWDDLRARAGDKYRSLRDFPLNSISLPRRTAASDIEHDIVLVDFEGGGARLAAADWRAWLDSLSDAGWRIQQGEWHHQTFERLADGRYGSTVSMEIHVFNTNSDKRLIVKGKLGIAWEDLGKADHIDVLELRVVERDAPPLFAEMPLPELLGLDANRSIGPVICADFNHDDYVDILLPNLNTVLLNREGLSFERGRLCKGPIDLVTSALYADFSGDGRPELLCGGFLDAGQLNGTPGTMQPLLVMYSPDSLGQFSGDPRLVFSSPDLHLVSGLTSGDVDGDGFADLWLSQYKPPYEGGQMPDPYYDANDGHPSFLLLNREGGGGRVFDDHTQDGGLAAKRFRRTYAATFVELDNRPGLDLIVTSDFAGVDVFINNGAGHFSDATAQMLDNPRLFGMAHCLADFNIDGAVDILAIGMSSTTAKRLHAMEAGLPGYAALDSARLGMAWGNRMYFHQADNSYAQSDAGVSTARTGWSWGCADLDFDNDGDPDVYIANGHDSKTTARDYCTHFWRDDIYRADSHPDSVMSSVYSNIIRGRRKEGISWNPFEKNHLFLNRDGREFVNIAWPAGVALEEDSRSVAAVDFDNDGRMDLLVGSLVYRGNDRLRIYHNLGDAECVANNWIGLRLRETAEHPLQGVDVHLYYDGQERDAVVVNGDSFLTQAPPHVHFGLGRSDRVDSLTVQWPDGFRRSLIDPAINRWHDADELLNSAADVNLLAGVKP